MIATHFFVIGACILFLLLSGCASPQKSICPRVEFANPTSIEFTDNERILLCGDPKTASWNDIPPAQAEFTLRNLLRQRGHFEPRFEWNAGTLTVDPGPVREIRAIEYSGEPESFHELRLRDVIGKPLTSKSLDLIQNHTLNRLKNLGYGCPKVEIQADERTGVARVRIDAGTRYTFGEVRVPDAEEVDLHQNTMRKFDAFERGGTFRQEWVQLTSNRAENDGIVIASEFVTQCESAPATALDLEQKILGGDKRLVSIGVGASTEEFPIAELRFKNVRLDYRGSHLQVLLYGSQRRQKIQTTYTDFPFHNAPRFAVAPRLTAEHRVERTFDTTDFELSLPLEYRGDTHNFAWLGAVGPAVSRSFSVDDAGSKTVTLLSVFGRLMLTRHDYELYLTDPRSGWYLDANVEFFSEGIRLQPFAGAYELTGSTLFRINPVEPPQWIFGLRWGLGTVDTEERPPVPGRLPARHFLQLGGDANLRGFGRQELNLGAPGALTSVFAGAEVRYAKSLALGIEPFVFYDIGALGSEPWSLEPAYFWNPGLGARVATPFGAVRGTVARGFVSRDDLFPGLEHVQVFFSFGREF